MVASAYHLVNPHLDKSHRALSPGAACGSRQQTNPLPDTMTDAMAEEAADPGQTYHIVERDSVPAPAPRPDDSLQERIAKLVKWLQPTDFLSPGNE
jgi:hypothetical protein